MMSWPGPVVMVDNINLQKIVAPTSFPRKINALNQKQGDKQDQQFKKHLKKEEDDDKNKDGDDLHKYDLKEMNINKQKRGTSERGNLKNHLIARRLNDDGSDKRIDIVV